MSAQDKIKSAFDRVPVDAVGVDCASNGVRAVRMKKTATGYSLVGAEVLPAVSVVAAADSPEEDLPDVLTFGPRIRGRYAALMAPGTHSVAKLLRLPEKFDLEDREQLMARLGAEKAEGFRVGTKVMQPATARTEALVLAVAMPERQADRLLALLPKAGLPAPRSSGMSELGGLTAFLNDPRRAGDESAHGLLHFDHDFSLLALFNQTRLSQMRTFAFGMAAVFKKMVKALNVDEETAAGVLSDGAFDVSQLIEDQMRDVSGQYVVCRDFMERSENCSLTKLYVSGPAALALPILRGAQASEPREAWSALDAYPDRAGGCMAERLAAEAWPLTAAIGGCLGILEAP